MHLHEITRAEQNVPFSGEETFLAFLSFSVVGDEGCWCFACLRLLFTTSHANRTQTENKHWLYQPQRNNAHCEEAEIFGNMDAIQERLKKYFAMLKKRLLCWRTLKHTFRWVSYVGQVQTPNKWKLQLKTAMIQMSYVVKSIRVLHGVQPRLETPTCILCLATKHRTEENFVANSKKSEEYSWFQLGLTLTTPLPLKLMGSFSLNFLVLERNSCTSKNLRHRKIFVSKQLSSYLLADTWLCWLNVRSFAQENFKSQHCAEFQDPVVR